jgi:hypothetical protein
MRWRVVFYAILLAAGANGATPIAACASCHPAETKLHAATRMANAMTSALDSSFAQNLPDQPLMESKDGYSFLFRRTKSGIAVTAFRAQTRADGLIEWVLGAGGQGQTPLIRTRESTLESHVSYFPTLRQYGITIGQNNGASANAIEALGHKQSDRDLRLCIGCHAMAITSDLQPIVPGVQCQRCHPGAEEHARSTGKAPFNPGKIEPEAQVRFCGSCHRTNPPVNDAELENVRFQPLRLMKSRCFTSGKLACTTCHPAHQDARRNDAAFYNQKCHSCHDVAVFHTDRRQTGDCIGCHMPYIQLHPALRFTDHYIRITKPGDLPESAIRSRGAGS